MHYEDKDQTWYVVETGWGAMLHREQLQSSFFRLGGRYPVRWLAQEAHMAVITIAEKRIFSFIYPMVSVGGQR